MIQNKPIPPVPAAKPRRDQSVGREGRERGEPKLDPNHWSFQVQETLVSALPDEGIHVTLLGGADNGYFLYLDDVDHTKITYHSGKLDAGSIVLEVQGQRISGFTLRDAMVWLKQVGQNGAPVMIKTVRAGQLPKDMRQYLSSRFPKGSIDHDLQQTIRDNLYLRTVPCTTREPRPGEVNGVDYTFLNSEEFTELEQSGSLLESGVFDGNLYGTPKPPKDPQGQIIRRSSSITSIQPIGLADQNRQRHHSNSDLPTKSPRTPRKKIPDPPPRAKSLEGSSSSESLGPLPPNWEMAYTEEGHPYFIDHNTENTHWLDPRQATKQKNDLKDDVFLDGNSNSTLSLELPYGWEKVEDPHYGTYYIDHVNRKTQYEHPGASLKKSSTSDDINNSSTLPRRGKQGDPSKRSISESNMNGRNTPPAYRPRSRKGKNPLSKRVVPKRVFVKNPKDLQGEIFSTRLLKGERGLGFTIIGGDLPNTEFLQIKNVVLNGPAFVDGKLQTGDVLVHVNSQCVLGFTHQDVVRVFQTIQPNEYVDLEVCRGYPLPFDPDDQNTEIITTIAVGHNDTQGSNSPVSFSSREMERHDLSSRSLKSLPELVKSASLNQASDFMTNKNHDLNTPDVLGQMPPEILTIDIVRGDMGFGFTIADSQLGQKVKQILDRPRCKNLQEGDFILQINSVALIEMSHSQVVQVLKDCPKGVETRIIVQRGGIPNKGRKPSKSDLSQGDGNISSNQPGAYFFNDKGDRDRMNGPVNDGDGYMNMSREVRDQLDSGMPPEVPRRPRTPSDQQNRPKTPTRLALQGDNNKPKGIPNTPKSAQLPRKEFFPHESYPGYEGDNSRVSDFNSSNRPPPGPRFDPFKSEAGSRADYRGRTNYSMHNSFDRDTYGRGETARPGQFRSRTPGPELMQRAPSQDFRTDRPKTPTASDMRSKTPIPGLYGNLSGGHPEFGRSFQNARVFDPNSRTWGSSIPENSMTPNMQRRDMSDSAFGRMNTNVGAGRPPRQSTSFEGEDPSPSNIMRMPRRPQIQNSNYIHPMSPKPYHYPSSMEERFLEMNVTLDRQESGFGFRIIGGTEEGSQVAVGHIVPGGAADVDGRLRTGDEILYCDGECVINSSHHRVVQLMGSAGFRGQVTLGVRRRLSQTTEGYPYDVTVTRRENEGFGFVIISSVTKAGSTIGEFIGRILENSPAERCGRLHVGDRILAVNGVDISHLHHEDIVNIIKESGYSVILSVGLPQEDSSSNTSTSHKGSQGSMVNAMAFPTLNDIDSSPGYRYPPPPPPKDINRSRMPSQQDIHENQIYVVDLNRGNRGFGFSIRGGQEFNNMPLFVLRIAEGGAADLDGRLRIGDQLLEINGYTTDNMNHSEAIDIIQNGGPTLRLLVRRTGKPPPSLDPSPSPGARYPPSGPLTNGPIGQSSPYLGRRNVSREENMYYNQPNRTYLNH